MGAAPKPPCPYCHFAVSFTDKRSLDPKKKPAANSLVYTKF